MDDLYTNVCRQIREALSEYNDPDLAIVQCIDQLREKHKEAIAMLDNVQYWETCPDEYAKCIKALSNLKGEPKTKVEPCYHCGTPTEVDASYEQEGCCDGRECGCAGMIINPIFCDTCMHKIEGEPK